MLAQLYLYSWIFISVCVIANIFTIIIEEGFMKQKYDNNYAWLHQHIKRHLGLEDSKGEEEDDQAYDRDGINVDSEVIISEYRLLYMKYKKQISMYKEAIANLSLKQIINNEEEAWVQHRMNTEKENEEKGDNDSFIDKDAGKLTEQAEKIVINVRAYEFDQEINQLSNQLKDKIKSLRKDYRDLKIFQNESDIQNAREKLLIFIRKLITDTNSLIATIQRNFDKNLEAMNKKKDNQ